MEMKPGCFEKQVKTDLSVLEKKFMRSAGSLVQNTELTGHNV
jgi:hypothetical protein